MKWCKQCKQNRPDDAFLRITKRRWKVRICSACARENMAKWARGVEMDANKVAGKGVDA